MSLWNNKSILNQKNENLEDNEKYYEIKDINEEKNYL